MNCMARHKSSLRRIALGIVATLALVGSTAGGLMAADNTATGNIAGVDANLDDSNMFTLNTVQLALVKTAFLTNGTQLNTGDTVPSGTAVRFLIYVDNPADVGTNDMNVSDPLVGFTYVPNSIKVDNSLASGATEAAIYAAVNATAALTDAVSNVDVAGFNAGTVSAGSAAGNLQVNIAANRVWAMLFEVTIP